MKPYLIGICGGSASGKTHLVKQLLLLLPRKRVTFISQDNYYHDLEEQVREPDGSVNFDHPRAVNLELLLVHLKQLLAGERVSVREYHFNNPEKIGKETWLTYPPSEVIIVEGMFVFHQPEVNDLFNLRVFVEADEHTKLIRRIRRDQRERGFELDDVLDVYARHVVPMYRRFVEPYKHEADIVLMSNERYLSGLKMLVNHVLYILESHDRS